MAKTTGRRKEKSKRGELEEKTKKKKKKVKGSKTINVKKKVVEEMKKVGVQNLREDKWEIEEELILKEGKIYVPKDKELRMEIIQLYHNTPVAGHGRR